MKIVASLDIRDFKKILSNHGLQAGGRVQKFIDSEVVRQCEPYTPFLSGTLARSPYLATEFGSGLVTYSTPYAHYQYYGIVYGPNIPMMIDGEQVWRSPKGVAKTLTDRKLQYNQEVHPMAGSYWFERMKADKKDEILEGARRIAGGK